MTTTTTHSAFQFWRQLVGEPQISQNENKFIRTVSHPILPSRENKQDEEGNNQQIISPRQSKRVSMSIQPKLGQMLGEKTSSRLSTLANQTVNGIFQFWKTMEHVVDKSKELPLSSLNPVSPTASMTPLSPKKSIEKLPPVVSVPPTISLTQSWQLETKAIWERPLTKLPVYKDFLRLAPNISVDSISDVQLSSRMPDVKSSKVRQVLLKMTNLLEGENGMEHIDDIYNKTVTTENDELGVFSCQFAKVLNEIDALQYPKLVAVLKVCNQSIIAPSIIFLRLQACPVPWKDAGNAWKIHVQIDKDQAHVIHSKKQQNRDRNKEEEDFEFEWQLGLRFRWDGSDPVDLVEVSLSIVHLAFGQKTLEQIKQDVFTGLKQSLNFMPHLSSYP